MANFFDFIGQTYVSDEYSFDVQQTKNLYTEFIKSKKKYGMRRTPGMSVFCNPTADTGEHTVRGMWGMDDHLFAVIGSHFVEVFEDGTWSMFSQEIADDGQPAKIAGNPTQLFVCAGRKGYLAFEGDIAPISDAGFPLNARGAAFLNTYFLTGVIDTQSFQNSESGDGESWPADEITDAEAVPDSIKAIGVLNQEFWAFGSQTTQVFDVTEDVDLPFVPRTDVAIEYGVWAINSVQNVAGQWYLLAGSSRGKGMFIRMDGYTPTKFSTHAIDDRVAGITDSENCVSWTYEERGHIFYVTLFPGVCTLVYDVSTDQWHERTWHNTATNQEEPHRGYCCTSVWGKVLIGDRANGRIYEMSMSFLDDFGGQIVRERIAPVISNELKNIVHKNFALDGNMGIGLDGEASENTDPVSSLSWSNDGGTSWSSEYQRRFGKIGKKSQRAIWRGLGVSRRRVYRWRASASVDWAITGCFINSDI